MTLNIGVIGVGRMGAHHAQNIAGRVKGARLVAIADVARARVAELSAEWGVDGYADFRELIADPKVEAVVIVGPTDQREAMLSAALASGKPVFCEKPIALQWEAALRLRQAAAASKSPVQIGFMRRFDPGYAAARQKIAAGAIGRPVAVHAVSYDPRLAGYDYVAASGGLFVDLAIHDFDLVRFLMADEIAEVYAVGGVYKYERLNEWRDVDNGLATLKFAGGGFGTVSGSRNAVYGYDIRTEVLGTEGAIRIGYERQTPVLLLQEGGGRHDFVPFFLERFRDAYELELQAFVDAVAAGRTPAVGVEDGVRALAVALAADASQKSGRPVPVKYGT
ncbi:MAG TPA: inositol 2-dehydrogenase [Limnochordia bacterium]|nr:inositol 2-dehydrogenase [Limnochordia bacterium]